MEKYSVIWFLTCTVVIYICQAEITDLGRLKIQLNKLCRKHSALEKDVDDIWATIIASGINVQNCNANKTRVDGLSTNSPLTTVEELKAQVEFMILSSRKGFQNEKSWLRKAMKNLTKTFEDFQSDMTKQNIKVKRHLEKLDTETGRIDQSVKAGQAKMESVVNALDERTKENEKAQRIIDTRFAKALEDYNEKQHNLSTIEAELTRKISDVQQDYLKKQGACSFEEEFKTLKGIVREVQNDNVNINSELTKLKASCAILPPSPHTTTQQATTTATPPLPFLCNDGWKRFNDHCYLLVIWTRKTWDDAAAYCQARNSYLIEITTDEELKFVSLKLLRPSNRYFNLWIGATDRKNQGMFVYQQSGLQVPDKYWGTGEPNNYRVDYHCAVMYDFKYTAGKHVVLRDHFCSSQRAFVCEKP